MLIPKSDKLMNNILMRKGTTVGNLMGVASVLMKATTEGLGEIISNNFEAEEETSAPEYDVLQRCYGIHSEFDEDEEDDGDNDDSRVSNVRM